MQKTTLSAAAVAAYILLAGCSGGSHDLTSIPVAGAGQNAALAQTDLARTGIAPKYFSLIHSLRKAVVHAQPSKAPADLFVDDNGSNQVEILANGTWTDVGTISGTSGGISGPDGNFVDKNGRLYVTNISSDDITEYAPGATTPMFTYNAGMIDPIDVTVDRGGRVYEADWDSLHFAGFVNEYPAGVDAVAHSCSPGGGVEGVVVDARGNVFVSVEYDSGTAAVIEYAGGLKGCHATNLGIPLGTAGGMAMDAQGNLLVCDQTGAVVDVLAPPYTSITRTLGLGYVDPFHVTIDKKNNQVYVADAGNAEVRVLSYPSGTNVATLGFAQGILQPYGAVDGQNYVP